MSKFTLELDKYAAIALRIAVRSKLNMLGIRMVDETPYATDSLKEIGKWYEEHSHIDDLVRLYARLNRLLTGHKQYNAEIQFRDAP